MSEFREKLIAWLDQELPAEDAANVARHVEIYGECRSQVEAYGQLTETIDAYCHAALASRSKRRSEWRTWRPVIAVTAAAAAAVLLFLLAKPAEDLRPAISAAPNGVPAIAHKALAVPTPPIKKIATAGIKEKLPARANARHSPPRIAPRYPSANRNENWLPSEAPVYIAIPADALFPPGAFPEGVGFVADVNLRPDGSPQRLRLEPRLVGLQMRGTRP